MNDDGLDLTDFNLSSDTCVQRVQILFLIFKNSS